MAKTRSMILAALFTVLTAAGALIRIPTPVSSFTLQIFFAALSGLLLGPGWGAASQAVYVLLGLTGLPIFSTGGGLGAVAQPTFGFLLGLIPMAWITGRLAKRTGNGFWRLCGACAAGLAGVYLIGIPYMHLILTEYLQQDWTLQQTLWSGMLLFLPWDALKIAGAAWLYGKIRPILS